MVGTLKPSIEMLSLPSLPLKGVRMQRHKVGREQWWEATSVGGLKGVRMQRYNVGRCNGGRPQVWEV